MNDSGWIRRGMVALWLIVAFSEPALCGDRLISNARGDVAPRSSSMHPVRVETAKSSTLHPLPGREAPRSKDEAKTPPKPTVALSPWTTVAALMFVIGLILLVARLLRRHGSPFQQGIPAEALEVLGRRLIDQRHSVYLLRVGPRVLVVGSSPAGLQALGEIDDPVEVDLLAGLCRDGSKNSGFGSVFRNLIQGQIQSENRQEPGQRHVLDDTETVSRSPMRPPLSSTHRASLTSSSTPEDELMRRLRGERKSPSNAAMGGADG